LKENKRKIGFSYAWQGLIKVFCEERNLQIHLFIGCLVILASLYFRLNKLEWAIILIVICFVIVVEIINSVFERIIDYFKPDIHPQAKNIKDIAASAVLITAIFAIIIGLIIFLPKIISHLKF